MEARTCSQPGCSCAPLARGMCRHHYRKWLAAFPEARIMAQTRAAVLAAMPSTASRIAVVTGLAPQTVKRTLDTLRAEGQSHIGDFEPPNKAGMRFTPLHVAGPGEDAILTKKMQREQKRFTLRKCQRRILQRKKTAALPPSSRWAAALLAA